MVIIFSEVVSQSLEVYLTQKKKKFDDVNGFFPESFFLSNNLEGWVFIINKSLTSIFKTSSYDRSKTVRDCFLALPSLLSARS